MPRASWKPSPPARRWPVLAAVAVLVSLGAGVSAWSVLSTSQAEPLAPAVSTIAPSTPVVPPPIPPPAAPAAPAATSTAPTTERPAPSTTRRSSTPTAPARPSWSEDKLREALRRLQEPTSPQVRKCLESGKLYEQCTG